MLADDGNRGTGNLRGAQTFWFHAVIDRPDAGANGTVAAAEALADGRVTFWPSNFAWAVISRPMEASDPLLPLFRSARYWASNLFSFACSVDWDCEITGAEAVAIEIDMM